MLINFETEMFRNYFIEMVGNVPDYIFSMPSSTGGKYHNATQRHPVYGQIYHVYMFSSVLNHLLRLKHNREKRFTTPEERDAMRCVPVFHDAVKCGWAGSRYTVPDHPMLAARWVLETKVKNDIPQEYKQMIADMCEAHSGEWNKDRQGRKIMSEPRNDREFFIHECDILASRADLDWIISPELKTALGEKQNTATPDIEEYVLPFGKYKGRRLVEIFALDKQYIDWAKDNITSEPTHTLLQQLYKEET